MIQLEPSKWGRQSCLQPPFRRLARIFLRVFHAGNNSSEMIHYERRLPHWDVIGQPLFVTFRLHGSLPANRTFPPDRLSSGKAFVAMDRILDRAETGPRY